MGLKASISDPGPLDLKLNQALGPIEASTPRCDCSALDVAAHRQQQQKGTVLQKREIVSVFSKGHVCRGSKSPDLFVLWIDNARSLGPWIQISTKAVGENVDEFRETRL